MGSSSNAKSYIQIIQRGKRVSFIQYDCKCIGCFFIRTSEGVPGILPLRIEVVISC